MANELYDWMQGGSDQQQYALPVAQPIDPNLKRVYIGSPGIEDRQEVKGPILQPVEHDPWATGKQAIMKMFGGRNPVEDFISAASARKSTWIDKTIGEAATGAGDIMREGALPPGLRREDFTDIPDPSTLVGADNFAARTGGSKNKLKPSAWQPGDDLIEKAQAISALAGTGGLGGAGAEAGVALGAGPMLRPALKFEGKIYKAPVGGQHLDALTPEMYTAFQKKAMAGDDINHYEFGFMNHKGQFLDRQKALYYAIKEGMVDEHAGKYGALTSTLLADSSKPGTAIEALAKTGKLKEVAHDPFTGDTAGKTYWDDLSKTKLSIPVEDMRSTHVPTEEGLLKRQLIKPEQLQGSIIIPAVGDRTMAGTRLTHINEKPLDYHVEMQGGPDYMRGISQMKDQSVWASDKGPITRMAKYARKLAKDNEGTDLNLVYSSMGARSGDYSHHMTDALLSQMKSAPVTKKAIKEFDTEMKDINPKWPGLSSPKLRDVLLENGKMRKQFVEEMALGEHQGKGFPDIGSTRAAITDPRFIGQPTGVTGYSMARLDPTGKIITDQKAPHITYRSKIAGKYLGGLDEHIPREIMFPDFYAGRRAASKKPLSDDRAFTMSNVHQVADQKWLDNLMKHIEATRQ